MGKQSSARLQRRLQRASEQQSAEWTPLVEVETEELSPERRAAVIADARAVAVENGRDFDEESVAAILDSALRKQMYMNDVYTVMVDRSVSGGAVVHLSIRRNDRQRPGQSRWRDFQRIKNELVGPECEGVELYPAESRTVDTVDQYALWVFSDPSYRVPVGWRTGLRTSRSGHEGSNAKQTPLPA